MIFSNTFLILSSFSTPFPTQGLLIFWFPGVVGLLFLMTLSLPICYWASPLSAKFFHNSLILLISLFCLAFFLSADWPSLFLFFEVVGASMFLMVGIFGSRTSRYSAGIHFFGYSLVGATVFWLAWMSSLAQVNLSIKPSIESQEMWYWMSYSIPFLFKLPLYPAHDWLLRAHSEASLVGSVLLAAILLKLGGVGVLRVGTPLPPFLLSTSFLGLIMGPFLTLRQVHSKRLVAASSLGHMASVGAVLACGSSNSSVMMMVTHGLSSPFLFFSVVSKHQRLCTFSLSLWRGWLSISPLFVFFLLVSAASGWGFPPNASFFSEISSAQAWSSHGMMVLVLSLSACGIGRLYSLFLLGRSVGGSPHPSFSYVRDWNQSELIFGTFWSMSSLVVGYMYFFLLYNQVKSKYKSIFTMYT